MLGYLSLDIICSSKLTVWKTVRFSEQIKYPRTNIGACCLSKANYIFLSHCYTGIGTGWSNEAEYQLIPTYKANFTHNKDNNNLTVLVLISPVFSLKVDEVDIPLWMRTGKSNRHTITEPSATSKTVSTIFWTSCYIGIGTGWSNVAEF